ncbi:hypothetical protein CBR_g4059 [Chara braunii]|uniref:ATP synthase mitochondrial F1 complex assembly factor 2 n=1 Tax=Chara braunii TaxID=69332 RepID=A0A388KH30_CHABU|nr:hypothetical protein CBR_g4059 [Chara braunii]|eukprot:GBG69365.1 hypothetical protein CBR_g4059 [Chara braunii]
MMASRMWRGSLRRSGASGLLALIQGLVREYCDVCTPRSLQFAARFSSVAAHSPGRKSLVPDSIASPQDTRETAKCQKIKASAASAEATRSKATFGRLYKKVDVQRDPNLSGERLGDPDLSRPFTVQLDGYVLRTPAKKPLHFKTEALALAVAAEWEMQQGRAVLPFTMPLMKLVSTAVDQMPRDRLRVIESLLEFFHTDALCCRAPELSRLAERQAELGDPLLAWIEREFGFRPSKFHNLFWVEQPPAAVEAMRKVLLDMDLWELTAVDSLAGAARSLIIALAVSHNRLSVSSAVKLARLEEDFQVEEWGFVEGGHDLDLADMKVRITAPSIFLRLLRA